MAAQSLIDNEIVIDDPKAAAISDDAASSMRLAIKTEPRILVLVFRRNIRYYNSVWAVNCWSNFCHAMCGGRSHDSFTFVVDHSMF